MRTIAGWFYLILVRYTYIPVEMTKISNAVTTIPIEIMDITIASMGNINNVAYLLAIYYKNTNILEDVSFDSEGVEVISRW